VEIAICNGPLRTTAGVVEVTECPIAHCIAENLALLRVLKHGPVQCFQRSRNENEKYAVQVMNFEAPLFPNDFVFSGPTLNGSSRRWSNDHDARTTSEKGGYLLLRCFASSNDDLPGTYSESE
jgi:hypothetical protein